MPAVDVDSRISANKPNNPNVDRGGSRRKRKHSPDEAVGAGVNNGTDAQCKILPNFPPILFFE